MKNRLLGIALAVCMAVCLTACAQKAETNTTQGTNTAQGSAAGSGEVLMQDDGGADEILQVMGTGKPQTDPQYELCKDNCTAESSTVQSTPFHSAEGQGKIIRVWLKNNTDVDVNVYLQKYKEDTDAYTSVLTFCIDQDSDGWNEYQIDDAETGIYRLRIEPYGGKKIDCEYQVVQTSASAADQTTAEKENSNE